MLRNLCTSRRSASTSEIVRAATKYLHAAPAAPGVVDLTLINERATITLDNEAHRNALTPHMMLQLSEAIEELERWDGGRCVVLRGSGGTFCTGADLSAARSYVATPEDGALMCAFMQHWTTRLSDLALVSVAQVEGFAIGGGTELSTATDYRVFASDATWRMVHMRMGVTPGWGGGRRLVKLVGRQHALRLLGTAVPVQATDALAINLADAVADGADGAASSTGGEGSCWGHIALSIEDAIEQIVEEFRESGGGGALSAARAAKMVVANADAGGDDDDAAREATLAAERCIFTSLWGGDANKAALQQK